MENYYPPLIFDIILSILKQAEFRIGNKSEYHYLGIYLYNEIGEDNFEALELFNLRAFYELDTFYLIDCGLYFGENPYSPFIFRMGMDKCRIIFDGDELTGLDSLKFKEILPNKISRVNPGWRFLLLSLISLILLLKII